MSVRVIHLGLRRPALRRNTARVGGHSACACALARVRSCVGALAELRACVHLCVVPEHGLFESPLLVCVIVCCNVCILRVCVCFFRERGGGREGGRERGRERYDVCLCVFSSMCETRKEKMAGGKPRGYRNERKEIEEFPFSEDTARVRPWPTQAELP
jgi:hypothetical protein